jgi:formylglycine-generating enzyme required for sulfatase activity
MSRLGPVLATLASFAVLVTSCNDASDEGGATSNDSTQGGTQTETGDEGGDDTCEGLMVPEGMKCVAGGSFVNDGLDGGPSEERFIETLFVDETEVLVGAYAQCVTAGSCTAPGTDGNCMDIVAGGDDHPVNCVYWAQAVEYCAWRDKRLPTEWEWEWAARGRDEGRIHPWGDEAPGDRACWWFADPTPTGTCSAGSYSPDGDSRDGIVDLAGNVWEWTDDWHNGPPLRVVRGGTWANMDPDQLSASHRLGLDPEFRSQYFGFRCVRTAG